MWELNSEQLKQVSGGVIFAPSDDADTYHLILAPYELFVFANFKTTDTYFFKGNGDVLFINPLNNDSYPVSFPYKIRQEQYCEYSVPSSFFKFSA